MYCELAQIFFLPVKKNIFDFCDIYGYKFSSWIRDRIRNSVNQIHYESNNNELFKCFDNCRQHDTLYKT